MTWRSYLWDIPRGVLKFAINAGLNTLPSLDNLKRWGKRVSDRCSFCGNTQTLLHVLSNCRVALDQGCYTWRHNSVLSNIIGFIRPKLAQGSHLFSDLLLVVALSPLTLLPPICDLIFLSSMRPYARS